MQASWMDGWLVGWLVGWQACWQVSNNQSAWMIGSSQPGRHVSKHRLPS